MARSNSFNKREVEKKKQEKRVEKQKRKDERKASGGSGSFEDMIAYVDENGVITSTPPDLTKKQAVDMENIAISTPKKKDVEDPILNISTQAKAMASSNALERWTNIFSTSPARLPE